MEILDLFILPSRWEALGLVLLEAMRASTPIIASACGAIPEIVVNNQTGWLVPPEDSKALSSKVIETLGNPIRLKEIGRAGRIRQQIYYSLDRMVQKMDLLYSEVMSGN
jgi:glycosyltransferase involved in cell wall biosynthesis